MKLNKPDISKLTPEFQSSPFPWFGGKSKASGLVWSALGNVQKYVEPFAGSLAVLLDRPNVAGVEIVNDIDRYIVNFWRAAANEPDTVARYANNPMNEADLLARHLWLVNTGADRISRLEGDPDFYDAKVAGWWVWGIATWIGAGWCGDVAHGPWYSIDGKVERIDKEAQKTDERVIGKVGVTRKRINVSAAGMNREAEKLHGDFGTDTGLEERMRYMRKIARRMRYVRVVCGDWSRVVTDGAMSTGGYTGVFLDPPYDQSIRDGTIYNEDEKHLSADVRTWAVENGDNPKLRIVLAGYEGEHDMPKGWKKIAWIAGRSFPTANKTANGDNRFMERLWLSPHCITPRA